MSTDASELSKPIDSFAQKYIIKIAASSKSALKFCSTKYVLKRRNELQNDEWFHAIKQNVLSTRCIDKGDILTILSVLSIYGLYNLMDKIIEYQNLGDICFYDEYEVKSEVMTATECPLDQQQFNYRLSDPRELSNFYLAFVYDMFSHPDFTNINDSNFNKIFRKLSSTLAHAETLENSNKWKTYFGILLISYPQRVLKYIKSQTISQLKHRITKLTEIGNCKCCLKSMKPIRISLLIRRLKKCAKNSQIRDIGISYLEEATQSQDNMNPDSPTFGKYIKYQVDLIKNNEVKTIQEMTMNLLLLGRPCGSLYRTVMYLRELSNWYYYLQEYWMGYQILQNAYKLANGYILQKSFIETDYKKKKQKYIKQLSKFKCSNTGCNRRHLRKSPLRACYGCMRVAYCSKKCQKIHWNAVHNEECNKQWETTYCARFVDEWDENRSEIEIDFNIPIMTTDECINKITNGDDIVAEKSIILEIGYPFKCTLFFEIKRSRNITKKEMAKSICHILKRKYLSIEVDIDDLLLCEVIHSGNGVYRVVIDCFD